MDGSQPNIKRWIVLYPIYINSKKTIAEGRRISAASGCENPTCIEICDCCSYLKIPSAIELDKAYPRDFMQKGRVRVLLKREDGSLYNPAIGSNTTHIKVESGEGDDGSKRILARLLQSKSKDKVVYAESGEDLVDQLFSFFTFTLGSIVKLLDKQSSLGCMDNLYQSVELLSEPSNDYFISKDCKDMLLSPKLATHFACSKQLLRIDEDTSTTTWHVVCGSCLNEHKNFCSHGFNKVTIPRINPKLPTPRTEHGGGFVKRSVKFMVTNDMFVAPFSSIAAIKDITELEMPANNLTEREESRGEAEVLNLLKACLSS